MNQIAGLPIVSIVGRKNSGKTTLVVALAAELGRRGLRVASVKHGHHEFEIDEPGRDSWRHFNEGGVEAVMMIGSGKVALIARDTEEPDPEALIRRHLGGGAYHIVLVEGYKHGPFPKVEVHRSSLHENTLHDPADAPAAAGYLALITDRPDPPASCPVIPWRADHGHVSVVADLLQRRLLPDTPHAG